MILLLILGELELPGWEKAGEKGEVWAEAEGGSSSPPRLCRSMLLPSRTLRLGQCGPHYTGFWEGAARAHDGDLGSPGLASAFQPPDFFVPWTFPGLGLFLVPFTVADMMALGAEQGGLDSASLGIISVSTSVLLLHILAGGQGQGSHPFYG